jgi:hypothetical protein
MTRHTSRPPGVAEVSPNDPGSAVPHGHGLDAIGAPTCGTSISRHHSSSADSALSALMIPRSRVRAPPVPPGLTCGFVFPTAPRASFCPQVWPGVAQEVGPRPHRMPSKPNGRGRDGWCAPVGLWLRRGDQPRLPRYGGQESVSPLSSVCGQSGVWRRHGADRIESGQAAPSHRVLRGRPVQRSIVL